MLKVCILFRMKVDKTEELKLYAIAVIIKHEACVAEVGIEC
jgi:hypothetical protein